MLRVDSDILVPAAREDVVDDVIAKTTTARLVVESANLPTTADARSVLFARGITVVPDFIANAGGIVAAAHSIGARYSPFTIEPDTVLAMLSRKMRANATSVVRESKAQHLPAHEAALTLAQQRVRSAMDVRGQIAGCRMHAEVG